jgi:hypothetical protein
MSYRRLAVLKTYVHIVGVAVVRATLVAVVQQPDVSKRSYLVVWLVEKCFKVLCLLCDFR